MKICLSCEGVATTELDRCAHCGVPLLPTSAAHFPQRRGEADSTNPLLGTVIDGKFLVQGVLGRGGMGTVFRACHAVSLVPLALKLLHPRLSARAEYRRALLAEARKAGRVVHEHCARILDVGETEEGTVYLAMELADGESLDAWVRGGGLPPAMAVVVAIQICQALVAIHQAGLVHRDLSSRNVMIAVRDGQPVVKVLDFGIAQSLRFAPAAAEDAKLGESLFANPVFSAPEHLAGLDVDARADLYSLGVLLYFMLSGNLPVEGRDARAAARATVTGQLSVLQPLQAVPRSLLRLVHSCLQLDRERRPASAVQVLADLRAVVHGRLRWLPRVSLAAMAFSIVLVLLTYARMTVPFLRVVGGSLVLVEGSQLADAPVRYLQPSALRSVRALYGGFVPQRLELEVSKGNTLQWRRRLLPAIDSEGVLVLSDAQESWRDALLGVERASSDGPVDVAFVVPGVALLGGARLCLDATAPQVELELMPKSSSALNSASTVRLTVRESAGLESLHLVLRLESGASYSVPLPMDAEQFGLGAAMTEIVGVGGPLGAATLTALAVDRAGNRAASAQSAISECDFGAPAVEVVTGPAGESSIPFLEDRAVVRVRLHHDEGSLTMEVHDDQGRQRSVSSLQPLTAGWYEAELGAAGQGEAFASGLYAFTIIDGAGNRQQRTLSLAFRSRRLDAVFTPSGEASIAVLGGELATGQIGGTVAFTCSPTFVPVAATLRAQGGGPGPASAKVELAADAAQWQVAVRGLEPGTYELVLELEERGGGRTGSVAFHQVLQVLPTRLALRLPECREGFLPALQQANLLRSDGAVLRPGAGLRVDGGLSRYLRGRLWSGADPQRLLPQPLLNAASDDGSLLPPCRLLRGRNVLAVELVDVLGRDVEVWLGDERAPLVDHEGRPLSVIADFVDDPTPPQLLAEELRVEFNQSVRLALRSTLQFAPSATMALRLVVQGVELPAAQVRGRDGGSEIAFVIPFALWRTAKGLADLSRADYSKGVGAVLPARLTTPAGDFMLDLVLRTARSALRVLRLDEVSDAVIPSALAEITFVPVLAPDGGEWPDPVPADAPQRGLYRPQFAEPVRGLGDLFVQDREITLLQYQALLHSLPSASGRKLAHRDDPLGDLRFTIAAMLPHGCDGDEKTFARAASATPAAAVTGIDFFQAYAAVRLLGVVVAGDPALFRLPLGCELELAAFGPVPGATARNAATGRGGRVQARSWREPAVRAYPFAGPAASEASASGDRVPSEAGVDLLGLDFGVREWVLDLPQGRDTESEPLLREWIADRELHVQRALELSGGRAATVDLSSRAPADLQARLRTFAVVRGLGTGELHGLLDDKGLPIDVATLALEALPASVPGVVRTEQLRRDGRDLMPLASDPRLAFTGFRVVGGNGFVQRVRSR